MTRQIALLLPLTVAAMACQPRQPAELGEPGGLPPATEPEFRMIEFASPAHGIRLSYPAELKPADPPQEEFILWLVPAVEGAERDEVVVSVDVPKLPPHIPGLIPLGSVVRGYIDDLKKNHPDVMMEKPVDTKVGGTNARFVRSSWEEPDGTTRVEDAVLTVKGDRVYIFRGSQRVHDDSVEIARLVLGHVIASVRWE